MYVRSSWGYGCTCSEGTSMESVLASVSWLRSRELGVASEEHNGIMEDLELDISAH